jgi:anti-anti-sigma factor
MHARGLATVLPLHALKEPVAVSQLDLPGVTVHAVSDHTIVVALSGEHDLSTRQHVLEALARARVWRNVIVDLTGCTFVDSSIVSAIFAASDARFPLDERLELVVSDASTIVNRATDALGVRSLLATHPTLGDALASVGEPESL